MDVALAEPILADLVAADTTSVRSNLAAIERLGSALDLPGGRAAAPRSPPTAGRSAASGSRS